jgi:hypothetical protein
MKGQRVCHAHGGRAKQNKQAAVRNLALKRAQRMVEFAGVDMDPIAHLLDSLYRQAALVGAYGVLVSELEDDQLTRTNKLGDGAMHPFVVAYERANSERARIAKTCGDLKIGERQIQLAERMGEQLATLFERAMARVPDLPAQYRQALGEGYAKEIAVLERPVIDGREAA